MALKGAIVTIDAMGRQTAIAQRVVTQGGDYLLSVKDNQLKLRAARLHWGIENGFHRCLDVAFREDASAIRLRNAAANFALLRRFALNLFRLDKRSKKSLPKKRKDATWNSRYVVDLLNLRPLQKI